MVSYAAVWVNALVASTARVSIFVQPSFALISLDDIESLEETLILLSDPEAMAGIRQSKQEFAAGNGIAMTKDEMTSWLKAEHAG